MPPTAQYAVHTEWPGMGLGWGLEWPGMGPPQYLIGPDLKFKGLTQIFRLVHRPSKTFKHSFVISWKIWKNLKNINTCEFGTIILINYYLEVKFLLVNTFYLIFFIAIFRSRLILQGKRSEVIHYKSRR